MTRSGSAHHTPTPSSGPANTLPNGSSAPNSSASTPKLVPAPATTTTTGTTATVLTAGIASTRARYKKLNFRHNLHILRESDLDIVDDNVAQQKAETGVEKSEESEYHLQAALKSEQAAAAGDNVKKTDIPVRPAAASELPYDKYYSRTYNEPATYIRFSSTVEDCTGCPYDMDEADATFLKVLNKKRKDPQGLCSEKEFEQVMYGFEIASTEKQPFSAVDGAPVLGLEDLEPSLEEWVEEARARKFAKEIYPHWKSRRFAIGNKPIQVSLKVETGAETDDADPYVCFRRRELRQTRKTRGRDAHSSEKLKKLRKELEEARELMALIKHREITKREQLTVERLVFEQRTSLRQVKQNLPEQFKTGDDDLLINQKKKKPLEITQRQPGQATRAPAANEARLADDQLVSISELLAKQEREIQEQIEARIATHQRWNEGWVDLTTGPLTASPTVDSQSTFRTAVTEYLPTPPASISSELEAALPSESEPAPGDNEAMDVDQVGGLPSPEPTKEDAFAVRYASPSVHDRAHNQPSFRRRIGRGGRLWIDRRGMRAPRLPPSPPKLDMEDRFKYDQDDDDEELPTYYFDPYSNESLQFRAAILRMPLPGQARRLPEGAASASSTTSNTPPKPGIPAKQITAAR